MDMMGMGPVDPTVVNLPLSDPRCVAAAEACTAFYAAENYSQEVTPWAGQFEYGHWATYYYVCIIFILMLVHILHRWHDHKSRRGATRRTPAPPSMVQKLQALARYLAYRRFTVRPVSWLALPAWGMLSFLVLTMVFLIALVFAERPYYRPHFGYGSPPIAIRTGLMAFACTPILIALAGKANFVTLLTGISHEKLNVVHRWVAWMTFALSLVHTIPFFIASVREGGAERVRSEFYRDLMPTELSGVPPLAILFGLCIFSLPQIRHRVYETFYYSHIVMAITYIGLLFWHSANTLDSWAYLWATIALWLASYLLRVFWKTRPLNIKNQWLIGAPTTLQRLPGEMTRMEVLAPPAFRYIPAQHVFLRFPSIALLDNHPFTISNAPRAISAATKEAGAAEDPETLVFLARSHAGFTRRLAAYCVSRPDTEALAWIDGPYGGLGRPVERLYDNIILVAGGTGISACLPWLEHVVSQAKVGANMRSTKVVLIWAMRRIEHFEWASKALEVAGLAPKEEVDVQIKLYVTGMGLGGDEIDKIAYEAAEKKRDDEIEPARNGSSSSASTSSRRMARLGHLGYERPCIGKVIPDLIGHGKTMVFGCGPPSLRLDLARACSSAQLMVLKGQAQEVAMHLEVFGW